MIPRENYIKRIRPFMDSDLVKVLTGMRRSGKSVMLDLLKAEFAARGVQPQQMVSFNFEAMEYAHLCTAEALRAEILARATQVGSKVYLFLDEIQEVENWERCINSLRVELDCDIYLTGSNARLLSGELATYLAGRYVEFVVYPFSFSEFIALYHTVFPSADTRECFQRYLTSGGLPYLANLRYEEEPCRQYLTDLFSAVEIKDIVRRNNIRDVDMLERVVRYITVNVGNTFSSHSISRFLKNEGRRVAPETVMNYIKACSDAFLFYQVRCQDLVGKKTLSIHEKYYMADHGLREAVFGGNLRDINLILENIVYLEMRRRGYQVTVGRVGEREIDFVCEAKGHKLYVQIAYLLASQETIAREFGAFDRLRDNFPKYVVSLDELDMSRDGIKHRNIRDFLLAQEWD